MGIVGHTMIKLAWDSKSALLNQTQLSMIVIAAQHLLSICSACTAKHGSETVPNRAEALQPCVIPNLYQA